MRSESNILDPFTYDAYWPRPRHRDYAAIGGDTDVYREVLEISAFESFLTAERLLSPEEGLPNRFRKLLLIRKPSKTNVNGMLTLLEWFNWLRADERLRFAITPEGRDVLKKAADDPNSFRRTFAVQLHECYTIPGWFVNRLHELNPEGQGEIILPGPPRTLSLGRRDWRDHTWPRMLNDVVAGVARSANKLVPGAFPIATEIWLTKVVEIWNRLASGAPPVNRYASAEKNQYAVRERLFHAMREASIELLFGIVNPVSGHPDFSSGPRPISYRGLNVWCPRLSEIEFIFYTDYHPKIQGRLIVPCGAFRSGSPASGFAEVPEITDPSRRSLWLYQPKWHETRSVFLKELLSVYREESRRIGALYVSLLVVRDEICRRLRLSALLFDRLMESAYEYSLSEMVIRGTQFSISLESDIRPDQRNAIGLNQRPVYIHRIPHSLIAIGTNRLSR